MQALKTIEKAIQVPNVDKQPEQALEGIKALNYVATLRGLLDYLEAECFEAANNLDLSHDFPDVVKAYLKDLK